MSKVRWVFPLLAFLAMLVPTTASAGILSSLMSKIGGAFSSSTSGGTSYLTSTSTVGKCGYDATRAGATGYNKTQKR